MPEASDEEVIDNGTCATDVDGVTAKEVVVEVTWAGLLLSMTVTVKVVFPLVVGVPLIVPADGESVSPAGRLPEVINQL